MPRGKGQRRKYAASRAQRRIATVAGSVTHQQSPQQQSSDDPAEQNELSDAIFREIDGRRTTATAVLDSLGGSPGDGYTELELALRRAQHRVLDNYKRELRRRSTFLSSQECWAFLDERLAEAKRFGVADALRALVAEAAEDFAGARLSRSPTRFRRLPPLSE